jgi:hypothetical protein
MASSISPLPPLQNTASITRPGNVTYHIPTSPSRTPLKTTIHLPPSSPWTSGLHWHSNTTEYLHLLRGSIFVTLGTATKIYHAAKPNEEEVVLKVDRGVRHNWGRADEYLRLRKKHADAGAGGAADMEAEGRREEEVVVEEWTDPSGVSKPLFFWNLNGVLTSPDAPSYTSKKMLRWMLGGYWIPFQLFVIFWELDNWPVFLSLEGRSSGYCGRWMGMWLEQAVEYAVTFSVLLAANVVGRMFGVEAVSEERTPGALWEVWAREKDGRRKAD